MPSSAAAYSNIQLAAVSQLVISPFGGKVDRVTLEAVRQRCAKQWLK